MTAWRNWRVQVRGDLEALRALAHLHPDITEESGEYVLRSSRFEGLQDAGEVQRHAVEIIAALNGIATLTLGGFSPVWVGAVLGDKETRPTIVIFPNSVVARAGAFAPTVGDGDVVDPATALAGTLFRLAAADPEVAEALRLFREDSTWVDLYKILEVIEGGGGDRGIVARGWATKGETGRFTHTANAGGADARHAVGKFEPPPRPMSLPDARQFIGGLMHTWLADKAASLPGPEA